MDEITQGGGFIGAPMSGDMFDDSSQMKMVDYRSGPNRTCHYANTRRVCYQRRFKEGRYLCA